MNITALEVDGYGVWTGLKLDGLSGGLNVFYGANEAGKTTLMQFVRSVLYGFSPRRRSYLPPVQGGRPGGSLYLAGPEGRFQVSRHRDDPETDRETVALFGADGTRHGEHLLKRLIYHVDEPIFNNVFAVGLHELQELGTLGDTEAASLLYNLSAGLDRVSVVEVVRELEASRRRLLAPDGRPCRVAQLLAQRDSLRAELESLGRATGRYTSLLAEHEQAQREADRLEAESHRLGQQLRAIEIAIAVRDRWRQSAELAEQLNGLDAAEAIPDGAMERLEAIHVRRQKYQDRVAALKRQREQIRAEASGLKVNEALGRLAPRIEALGEQEDWIGSLQRRSAELEREIRELETGLHEEQKRLGLEDGDLDVRVPPLSSRRLAELRGPARELRCCRRRVEEAAQAAAAARQAAQSLAGQIETALAARGHRDLSESMARAGERVARLRRRIQLDERLDQMARHQVALEEQGHELFEHQLLPAWVLIGLGAVFVVGVVLLMAGLFAPESITGSLGWPLAMLGLVGTMAAVASKFAIERSNTRRLDACQKQIHMLEAQTKQARQEREGLDAQLAPGGGSLSSRLEAAEQDLSALEALVPLDARRQASAQEAETAEGRVSEAQTDLAAAGRRWREALGKAGLPEGLSPKQVRELAARGGRIGEIRHRLEIRYDELQHRARELDALTGRIAQLTSDAGLPPQGNPPIEQLHALAATLGEQESRRARREQLRSKARRLRRTLAKYDMAASRLKHLRRKLLRSAGVQSEPQLRELAEQAARAADLRRRREAVDREIDAAIGGQTTREAVAHQLDGDREETLEARREQVEKKWQATEADLRRQFEKRGRLAEQVKALAEDRTPAAKQLELACVQQRLREAVRRWRTLAVAGRILEDVRTTYERDRQPETLQEASTYLESLTQGRYVRVWTPLGEDVLLVEDAHGESLPVEVLSRGTREQLFVCLRLALAACYARRGAPLPLVLDDVLVNFDSHRAKAAAAVLRDYAAAGHQLLVFTCHEHIVKLFKSLRVQVVCLPDNAETDVTVTVPPKPAKTRRGRKPEPETRPRHPVPERPAAEEPIDDEDVDDEEEVEYEDNVEEEEDVEEEYEDEEADEEDEDDEEDEEAEYGEDNDDEEPAEPEAEAGDEGEYEEVDEYDDAAVDNAAEEDGPLVDFDEDALRDDWDDRYEGEYRRRTDEETGDGFGSSEAA